MIAIKEILKVIGIGFLFVTIACTAVLLCCAIVPAITYLLGI